MPAFILFLTWLVVGSIVRGLVFVKLWAWFLIPNLGAPEIGVAQALGVALMIGMLTAHDSNSSSKKDGVSKTEYLAQGLAKSVGASLALLLVGAIYHSFM